LSVTNFGNLKRGFYFFLSGKFAICGLFFRAPRMCCVVQYRLKSTSLVHAALNANSRQISRSGLISNYTKETIQQVPLLFNEKTAAFCGGDTASNKFYSNSQLEWIFREANEVKMALLNLIFSRGVSFFINF